jgi:hypothetical protein
MYKGEPGELQHDAQILSKMVRGAKRIAVKQEVGVRLAGSSAAWHTLGSRPPIKKQRTAFEKPWFRTLVLR